MSLGPGVPDMADKVCLSCKSSKDRNDVGLPVWNNRQAPVCRQAGLKGGFIDTFSGEA